MIRDNRAFQAPRALFTVDPLLMESSLDEIKLRPIRLADLPWMYECQLDRESNAMAVVIPRESTRFFAHWEQSLEDPGVCGRLITVNGLLAGWVSRFPCEDQATIGYWIARDFWGQGVATAALRLLLLEDSTRPLFARVATSNTASLRVLQKNGFTVVRQEWMPECERCPASDTFLLTLDS